MPDVIAIGVLPLSKRFDKKYVETIIKHPLSQLVWGSIPCCSAAGLYVIPPNTTMNGPKYMELIKEKPKRLSDRHDSGQCHRSKVTTEFLKKNKFSVLECPGNSPDLNPVKNLWIIMKDKVVYTRWEHEASHQASLGP